MVALTHRDLISWNEYTTNIYRSYFEEHPELLQLPCDIKGSQTVSGVLQHIVAVELRYSERLNGEHETPYEQIPQSCVQALFEVHNEAMRTLQSLESNNVDFWREPIDFDTRNGRFRAARGELFTHCLLHSIRHYAQLATLLRQKGFALTASLDYLGFAVSQRLGAGTIPESNEVGIKRAESAQR